jgi:glycosyltransferase involved in cell wall biosynthesis
MYRRRVFNASPVGIFKGHHNAPSDCCLADPKQHLRKRINVRILYVNPNADLYGASRVLLRLIRALDKQTYQCIVVVPEEGPLADALRKEEVTVRVVPFLSVIRRRVFHSWRILPFLFFMLPSVLYLGWLILRERVALVHTNTGVILPAALAAWLTQRPHIWHLHEKFSEEFPNLWGFFGPFILRFSNRVFCVSTSIARQFPPNSKIQVLYNGLDLQEFVVNPAQVEGWRQKYTDEQYTTLIGVIGRISPRKGQSVFLEASARLKTEGYDNIRYLIVGDAFAGNEPVVDQLHTFVNTHDLVEDVQFVGFVAQPEPLIAALDLLVLPSILPEAFPTIVLEAMALGVPVIATNVGGTVEQIEDGVSGLLIPPNEPTAIATAIKCLLKDSDLRDKLGLTGHQRVKACFSLQTMSDQVGAVYQELHHKLQTLT